MPSVAVPVFALWPWKLELLGRVKVIEVPFVPFDGRVPLQSLEYNVTVVTGE